MPCITKGNGKKVVFDRSYQGELDPSVAKHVVFQTGSLITGWTSALMQMKEGDRWELYVPNELGYGNSNKPSIPAYSTLIFDLHLVKVNP